ncbi:MAG: carboxypeptidase regulatory-like domain-containing protein [Rubricoccaceae bacterium]|nr:carboxypeptidase regulatory-like domain-containing protein [Rubricoccaceae bacterium]
MSDNFVDAGAVAGFVSSYYPPFEGLPSVQVMLRRVEDPSSAFSGTTDSGGQFSIPNVPSGMYELLAEAIGYASVVDTVEVQLGALTELDLRMDGLPQVTSHQVRTEHISRWFPADDLFRLVIETTVDDPDGLGDIERVLFSVPDFNFSDTLAVTSGDPSRFTRTFDESQLPTTLQDLLGRTLQIEVRDRLGHAGFAPDAQIVRIIDPTPLAESPTFPDPVGPQPGLVWRSLDLPFMFTYRVNVVFVPSAGQQTLVGSYGNLSPSDTTFTVPDPLSLGDYSWTVAVEDVFGNRSRSKEAGFRVVSGAGP